MFVCLIKNTRGHASYRWPPAKLCSATLSNDNGDINENGKKAIVLDWQNNNFARETRIFEHFFAVVGRLRDENA